MAKVKIQGHASGTGVLTVTAPNTSTDRTITLPDSTGTILDENSSLPAGNLTGNLPAIDGSSLTGIKGVTVATTAPGTPSEGDLWFNSDTSEVSYVPAKSLAVYNGNSWNEMSNKFSATGGTVATSGGYTYHTFTSSGTFVSTVSGEVGYLIVAGGGSGAMMAPNGGTAGPGGGAGGLLTGTLSLPSGYHSIVVGGGGAQVAADTGTVRGGNKGSNSTGLGLTAIGGGGGSFENDGTEDGGSGGGEYDSVQGGIGYGTVGQGNDGGSSSYQTTTKGGGGGASAPGTSGDAGGYGGTGSNALSVWATATSTGDSGYYAGGGGGGAPSGTAPAGGNGGGGAGGVAGVSQPVAGTANTGGGGGGGTQTDTHYGAAGGSGIVIIRYAI